MLPNSSHEFKTPVSSVSFRLFELAVIRYIIIDESPDFRAKEFFRRASERGLEDIVTKDKQSLYLSGRETDYWRKIKNPRFNGRSRWNSGLRTGDSDAAVQSAERHTLMCGRYRLTKRRMLEIEDYYDIDEAIDLEIWKREYNIPPREMAPAVLEAHGKRRLTAGLWSLLVPWAESLEKANQASTFNAKAETLTERPACRNAFLKRRCIVPAEAFYEWVGPKKERQPMNIGRADGKLLSMAGLFNYWKPAASEGRPMLTFTVVTTAPSQWMARIHNRMPVILQDNQIDTWLDPTVSDPEQLSQLLKAPPEDFLDCYPVSRQVNSVKFDEAEYAERIDLDYGPLLQSES